jgi:hypothetical protein
MGLSQVETSRTAKLADVCNVLAIRNCEYVFFRPPLLNQRTSLTLLPTFHREK